MYIRLVKKPVTIRYFIDFQKMILARQAHRSYACER